MPEEVYGMKTIKKMFLMVAILCTFIFTGCKEVHYSVYKDGAYIIDPSVPAEKCATLYVKSMLPTMVDDDYSVFSLWGNLWRTFLARSEDYKLIIPEGSHKVCFLAENVEEPIKLSAKFKAGKKYIATEVPVEMNAKEVAKTVAVELLRAISEGEIQTRVAFKILPYTKENAKKYGVRDNGAAKKKGGKAEKLYEQANKYYKGKGVDVDLEKAAKLFEKSAKQGNAKAQNRLGIMYENGEGVDKNLKNAAAWYTKAAKQGYDSAQWNLGVMYANGNGVDKDPKKAAEWFTEAAEQGHAKAQYKLGVMYANGNGVDKDPKKAVEWYTKAAEQGNADAQQSLAIMYRFGRGVYPDDKKAAEWFEKAAEQGIALAQSMIAYLYEEGTGVSKDKQKAIEWYTKAAEQGNEDAKAALKRLQ